MCNCEWVFAEQDADSWSVVLLIKRFCFTASLLFNPHDCYWLCCQFTTLLPSFNPGFPPTCCSTQQNLLTRPDDPPPANHDRPMRLQSGDEPSNGSLLFLTTVNHTHWQSCDGHIVQLSQCSSPVWTNAAAAAAARPVSRANTAPSDAPDKSNTPRAFCIGIICFLLWVIKVRLEDFFF